MKNAHNSYWIKGNPLLVSIATGCDIIEADIIDKHLNLSHSWRPFKSMYYGNLIDRYLHNFPSNKFLYIKFKTGDRRVKESLYQALKEYKIEKVILSASPHPFIQRYEVYQEFIEEYRDLIPFIKMSEFKKRVQVKNVDLYERSIWHF